MPTLSTMFFVICQRLNEVGRLINDAVTWWTVWRAAIIFIVRFGWVFDVWFVAVLADWSTRVYTSKSDKRSSRIGTLQHREQPGVEQTTVLIVSASKLSADIIYWKEDCQCAKRMRWIQKSGSWWAGKLFQITATESLVAANGALLTSTWNRRLRMNGLDHFMSELDSIQRVQLRSLANRLKLGEKAHWPVSEM